MNRVTTIRELAAEEAAEQNGAGRELAWFPATARSVARRVQALTFAAWFWG